MPLPTTGTAGLLDLLTRFIPDDLINTLLPRHKGAGRRSVWSSAQLFRVTLLLLLTPSRTSNLLCQLLSEQHAWRRFAHLPNRRRLPNVRQLHEFRQRLTPAVLRQVNEHLLQRILQGWPVEQRRIALIDSTDLPAATNEYKKRLSTFLRDERRLERARKSRGKAGGTSATRSTPCGCGWGTTPRRFCSCP